MSGEDWTLVAWLLVFWTVGLVAGFGFGWGWRDMREQRRLRRQWRRLQPKPFHRPTNSTRPRG